MDLPTLFTSETLLNWLFSSGLKIVLILLAAWLATRLFRAVIFRFLGVFMKKIDGLARGVDLKFEEERLKTLQKVAVSAIKTAIWIIAVITVLPEIGVNIGPLLAGLGIGGLALGFGAKTLIQDYLSGLFALIEDHYRVGEEVELAGLKGRVKSFNLRRTVIKDAEGNLHYLPNSQIKQATNFSRK